MKKSMNDEYVLKNIFRDNDYRWLLCEDCFANIHTDENGNYHYEEYWDK